MRLDELLGKARRVVVLSTNQTTECQLAVAVLDLFAEAAPCGLAEPLFHHDGIDVPNEWTGALVSAEDARHMARMLLRAADEAEAK